MRITNINHKKIRDARRDLVITVTVNDINSANTKDPSNCAIAKACERQEDVESRIHISRVYLKKGNKPWVRYMTPKSLRTEIIAFDRGGTFQAGNYILLAPKGRQKLGARNHPTRPRPQSDGNQTSRKRNKVLDIRTGPANGV
jgi:hypothetical protein